jgi:hypothetical protein
MDNILNIKIGLFVGQWKMWHKFLYVSNIHLLSTNEIRQNFGDTHVYQLETPPPDTLNPCVHRPLHSRVSVQYMYFPTVGRANSANCYSVMWEACDQCVLTFSIDRVCLTVSVRTKRGQPSDYKPNMHISRRVLSQDSQPDRPADHT